VKGTSSLKNGPNQGAGSTGKKTVAPNGPRSGEQITVFLLRKPNKEKELVFSSGDRRTSPNF